MCEREEERKRKRNREKGRQRVLGNLCSDIWALFLFQIQSGGLVRMTLRYSAGKVGLRKEFHTNKELLRNEETMGLMQILEDET